MAQGNTLVYPQRGIHGSINGTRNEIRPATSAAGRIVVARPRFYRVGAFLFAGAPNRLGTPQVLSIPGIPRHCPAGRPGPDPESHRFLSAKQEQRHLCQGMEVRDRLSEPAHGQNDHRQCGISCCADPRTRGGRARRPGAPVLYSRSGLSVPRRDSVQQGDPLLVADALEDCGIDSRDNLWPRRTTGQANEHRPRNESAGYRGFYSRWLPRNPKPYADARPLPARANDPHPHHGVRFHAPPGVFKGRRPAEPARRLFTRVFCHVLFPRPGVCRPGPGRSLRVRPERFRRRGLLRVCPGRRRDHDPRRGRPGMGRCAAVQVQPKPLEGRPRRDGGRDDGRARGLAAKAQTRRRRRQSPLEARPGSGLDGVGEELPLLLTKDGAGFLFVLVALPSSPTSKSETKLVVPWNFCGAFVRARCRD